MKSWPKPCDAASQLNLIEQAASICLLHLLLTMSEPNKKRFKLHTDTELEDKQQSLQNKNTLKNEKKAEKAFKLFLTESGADPNFYVFTEKELDSHLCKFWFAARTEKGNLYRVSSLENMRHSLNRALKRYGHEFDITKPQCTSFTKSIKAFRDACAELKQQGQGYMENMPEITTRGIKNNFSIKVKMLRFTLVTIFWIIIHFK